MRRALLLALLLVPVTLPSGEAAHPPAPAVLDLLAAWKRGTDAPSAVPASPPDHGLKVQQLRAVNRSAASGVLQQGALDFAAMHAFALYLNMTAQAPRDNGSHESRHTQRLWWLNESTRLEAGAKARVATVVEDLRAFQPRTVDGLELGILAGRLALAAHLGMENDLGRQRERMEGFFPVAPDTTVEAYRSAAFGLVRFTAGSQAVADYAAEALALARRADAAGGTPVQPGALAGLLALLRAETANPTVSGPDQAPHAVRAHTLFNEGEPLLGIASFLLYDEIRRLHGVEFRLGRGTLNGTTLAAWRVDAATRAHTLATEAAAHGLAAHLLQDALAFERTAPSGEAAVSRLETSFEFQRRMAPLTAQGDPSLPTGTILAVVGLAGLAAVAWVVLRRRA